MPDSFDEQNKNACCSACKELRSKLANQKTHVKSNRIDPSLVVQVSWQPRSSILMLLLLNEIWKKFVIDVKLN